MEVKNWTRFLPEKTTSHAIGHAKFLWAVAQELGVDHPAVEQLVRLSEHLSYRGVQGKQQREERAKKIAEKIKLLWEIGEGKVAIEHVRRHFLKSTEEFRKKVEEILCPSKKKEYRETIMQTALSNLLEYLRGNTDIDAVVTEQLRAVPTYVFTKRTFLEVAGNIMHAHNLRLKFKDYKTALWREPEDFRKFIERKQQ